MVFLFAFWLVVLCLILDFFTLPVCYILGLSLHLASLHTSLWQSGMVKIQKCRNCSAIERCVRLVTGVEMQLKLLHSPNTYKGLSPPYGVKSWPY